MLIPLLKKYLNYNNYIINFCIITILNYNLSLILFVTKVQFYYRKYQNIKILSVIKPIIVSAIKLTISFIICIYYNTMKI